MRRLEERIRDLEWQLGRKNMEIEILREPLALRMLSQPKSVRDEAVAETLGVARSNLHDKVRRA